MAGAGKAVRPQFASLHRRVLIGRRACLPRLRLDRIKNVTGFGLIDDLHLVDESRRPVLHDRRGLGAKRHCKLRRMGIGDQRWHCDDQQHKGEQSRKGHRPSSSAGESGVTATLSHLGQACGAPAAHA